MLILRQLRIAAALASLVLVGNAAAANQPVLRVAYQDDMPTFDPDNGFPVAGLDALRAVYEGLVQYEPGTTNLAPWLAQSWTVSADQLTYSFELRPGVTFHDGSALTSKEVKASFERRKDGSLMLSYFLANVKAMEAPDADTFVITLNEPQPSFLDTLASPWGPKVIGPGALVANAGSDKAATWLNENAMGTGPFKLAEFSRGQRYVLARNDDYWGPKPYFEKIEMQIVPDIGQQLLLLQGGQIDMVLHGYPFNQLTRLPPNLNIESYNDLGLEMAFVNHTKALKDPALRKAVLTVLNPSLWLKAAFGTFAEPAQSLYPKAMLAPNQPLAFPTDMEAAKAAVANAGGVTLEIGYATEEASVQQRVAQILTAQLQQIGVTATSRPQPTANVSGFAADLAAAPDIWIAQNNPDAAHPSTQTDLFYKTGAPLNIFATANPEADKLLTEAARLTDVAERNKLYEEAGRLLFDNVAFIPLADIQDVIVYRAGLTNLKTRPALPWGIDFAEIRAE